MMKAKSLVHATALALAITAALPAAHTQASTAAGWQPMSSESLVRLPPQFMDKSLEQNFRESSLFGEIDATGTQVRMEAQRMADLKSAVAQAAAEQKTDLSHQLLVSKSSYLKLMQDKLALDEQALETRTAVYEQVLDQLQRDRRYASDPVTADLVAKQQAARARMEKTVGEVESLLDQWQDERGSEYQAQYGNNLAQIERLKRAISNHAANAAPALDGREVTREEYVRHLLANAESERAILEQEKLMLTYMAKLVSLDAQALEQALMGGGFEFAQYDESDPNRPANAADLFIN